MYLQEEGAAYVPRVKLSLSRMTSIEYIQNKYPDERKCIVQMPNSWTKSRQKF
jgi:hypothetical protein